MSIDVESELARLGGAWSKSVAHVDVAEVLERLMVTRAQPMDTMVDAPATSADQMRVEPLSRRSDQRWLLAAACVALVVAGVVAVAQRPAGGPDRAATNPTTTPTVPLDTAAPPAAVTVPALPSATSGGMWPQSTQAEVRAAQEFADAGDPSYTWQLDGEPWGAEIFARFIEDGLGWEEYSGAPFAGYGFVDEGDLYREVLFVRCASGRTNPLSAVFGEAPAEIRGCAPTIDDFTYETVSVTVAQPGRRDPSGIWVVSQWEMLPAQSDPSSLFSLLYPDYHYHPGGVQIAQVTPPSDADVTALLEAFLRARVDGEGAEQYLLREPEGSPFEGTEVPLLYATTSGDPYARSEMEFVQGPVWPNGWTEYKVRLFADAGTVVEQHFYVVHFDGRLGLVSGDPSTEVPTTENGQAVAVARNLFDGTLAVVAPPLVPRGDGRIEIALIGSDGHILVGTDPVPLNPAPDGCSFEAIGTALPIADDATMLARRIVADPGFETTDTVPVTIAGIEGLQMDVTFSEHDLCYSLWSPSRSGSGVGAEDVPPGEWRMRLYLVDYPESSWPSDSTWRPQVLTIAVFASEPDFDLALEEAATIVESLEFGPG